MRRTAVGRLPGVPDPGGEILAGSPAAAYSLRLAYRHGFS